MLVAFALFGEGLRPIQLLGGLLVLAVACVAVSVATFRAYQKNV